MIDFPTSPVLGDSYTYGSRTWIWNGSGWERVINAGQVVSVFVVGVIVTDITALPNDNNAWYRLDYV